MRRMGMSQNHTSAGDAQLDSFWHVLPNVVHYSFEASLDVEAWSEGQTNKTC